jgi:hypothetical protein
MHDNGGIFFVKKGWTILVAIASSDLWIVIVVVMGHTSKMDLASVLSQTASRIVVRKQLRAKMSVEKLASRVIDSTRFLRYFLVTVSRRLSSSYLPVFAYQIAYADGTKTIRITITIKMKANNMLHLSQEKMGQIARRQSIACP